MISKNSKLKYSTNDLYTYFIEKIDTNTKLNRYPFLCLRIKIWFSHYPRGCPQQKSRNQMLTYVSLHLLSKPLFHNTH